PPPATNAPELRARNLVRNGQEASPHPSQLLQKPRSSGTPVCSTPPRPPAPAPCNLRRRSPTPPVKSPAPNQATALAAVAVHAAADAASVVPLVVAEHLSVVGPVVVVIVRALVPRRVRPSRDVVGRVGRPRELVVHLVVPARVGRVLEGLARKHRRERQLCRSGRRNRNRRGTLRRRGQRGHHLRHQVSRAQGLVRGNAERDRRLLKQLCRSERARVRLAPRRHHHGQRHHAERHEDRQHRRTGGSFRLTVRPHRGKVPLGSARKRHTKGGEVPDL
ncbi:hypothetical protein T484DRAFT_3310199, partial [Baffinella frigidus]